MSKSKLDSPFTILGIFLLIILAEPICEFILAASFMSLCFMFISVLCLGMCLMVKQVDPAGAGLWLVLCIFLFGCGVGSYETAF